MDQHVVKINSIDDIPLVVQDLDIEEFVDNAWLEVGSPYELPDGEIVHDIRNLHIEDPFDDKLWDEPQWVPELLTDIYMKPEYLGFVCSEILNIQLLPYQLAILHKCWTKPLLMFIASRGAGKSWLLAVYCILRAILHQGCKIAVVGASLRQSMVIFNYVEVIWNNAPVLRDICGGEKNRPKRNLIAPSWDCGDSKVSFLPLGNGETIRGQRANVILCDEFASVNKEVFETVVRGFAAVKSEGVKHNVQRAYQKKLLKGLQEQEEINEQLQEVANILDSNQIIVAGTASYQFNHFYQYYKYYCAVIESGGDKNLLQQEFPDMTIPDELNPENYCVIRLPYDKVPPGLMDPVILEQGRATMDPQIFDMEYGAIFAIDSEGFYLASVLQQCTCPVASDQDGVINFSPKLIGESEKAYIMGIDPASEDDNFTISILEKHANYRCLVYQWSTNRKEFEELKRNKLIDEDIKDYNTFCVRHIRSLRRRFDCGLIVMDTGGGGVSVRESLKDPTKVLDQQDDLIYDMEDEDVEGLKGSHILLMIEFSNSKWRVDAHHGLRKDFLDRKVLFPKYDAAQVEVQSFKNTKIGKGFDTLAECYVEIEQCKQETTLIQHTQTTTGQEKWDVPKMVGVDAEQVKKYLKRDRFTSLLLANWGCRVAEDDIDLGTAFIGASSKDLKGKPVEGSYTFVGEGAKRMAGLENSRSTGPQNIGGGNRKIYF